MSPDLGESVERIIDSVKELVQDQGRLWRLELLEAAGHAIRMILALAASAVLAALAWVTLMMALHQILRSAISPEGSLVLIGALNAALAIGGVVLARHEVGRASMSERSDGR